MKIYKPYYYDQFQCIADACPFTCCKDWRISVDRETCRDWEKLDTPKAAGLDSTKLIEHVAEASGAPALAFVEGSCPFLNAQGLCHVVMAYGDSHIPKTCQQYPREPHVSFSRIEHNLELGCPAVIDLLIEGGRFDLICSEADDSRDREKLFAEPWVKDVDEIFYQIRDVFLRIMKDTNVSVDAALGTIFYMALELLEKEGETGRLTRDDLLAYLNEIDLPELIREIGDIIDTADPVERFAERNELLLDLMENYRRQNIYTQYIEPVAELAEGCSEEDYEDCDEAFFEKQAAIEAQCEAWMRLAMEEEIYSELILSGTESMEDMVIKLQWLGLQYAAVRQCIGLWMKDRDLAAMTEEACYHIFKKYLMVMIRMTGYTEDNIEEYLENSFEDIIWPWNYFGLIV